MSAVATGIVGGALISGYLSNKAASSAAAGQRDAANSANQLSMDQFNQTRADQAPWRNAGGAAIGQLSYLLGLPGYAPQGTQLGSLSMNGGYTPSGGPRTTGFVDRPNDMSPYAKMAMTKSMDEAGGGFGGGGDAAAGGPFILSARAEGQPQPGASYNTQLGDFGSLSRDFSMADFQADPGYAFRLAEGQKALERSASARGNVLGGGTLKALARYGQDMGAQEYGNAYNRFMNNRASKFNQLAAVSGIGQTSANQLGQLGAMNSASMGNNLMGAANASGAAQIAGANAWGSALNNGVNNWLVYSGYKK